MDRNFVSTFGAERQMNRLGEPTFVPSEQMDFYEDIYQLIFYYINSDSYLSVLLTCK